MIRFNLFPPSILPDQSIIAERAELKEPYRRLTYKLTKKLSPEILTEIPDTLNPNFKYMSFFYNKLLYLERRYGEVTEEMSKRGLSPNLSVGFFPTNDNKNISSLMVMLPFLNDWSPSKIDLENTKEVILYKLNNPPSSTFYTRNFEPVNIEMIETEIDAFISNLEVLESLPGVSVSANAYITEVEAIKTMEEFKEKAEDWKESFIPYTMKVRGAYKDKTIKDLLENAK